MRRAAVAAALVAASAYVIAYGLREGPVERSAHDVYAYFYPNILYALRALARGGQGLLWNPFQNCGQPFFAVTSVGLLYPLNLFFLVLEPPTALRAVLFGNLLIGGAGAYWLGCEIGLSRFGALGGALAFVTSSTAFHLTTWMPTVQGPYVWMPVAMWCCERLIKAPNPREALWLGMVLGVSLLPGHPQFVLFTCELIALRLLWSLFDREERRHAASAAGYVGLAVAVMLLLSAVQYLPGLEVAAESLRHGPLQADEIKPGGEYTWATMALNIRAHAPLAPFGIIPGCLVLAGLASRARARIALFYLLAAAVSLTLAVGDATWLGRLYAETPLGQMFRSPLRFIFVTGFCVSVLAGIAIDVLSAGSWVALILAGATLAALSMSIGQFAPVDWYLAAGLFASGVLAAAAPTRRQVSGVVFVAAVGLTPVLAPHWTPQRYLSDDRLLRAHAEVLERLRERLTPQERVHLVHALNDPGFQDKTAGLFELRAITDLEPQLTRRYAEYVTVLRSGVLLRSLNQIYYPGLQRQSIRWPLLDLAAVHYVLVDQHNTGFGQERLIPTDGDESVRVYENPTALPRAYYVPQIAVEPNDDARLARLASGLQDRRRLALVNESPRSGFLGVPGNNAAADARFVVDDPEHVVIETNAPERGFLFLADQYFSGWSAAVNGQATTILRANHAFRAVEVPRGPVHVEFVYHARRIWLGALVSAVTLLAVAATLVIVSWQSRQHRRVA